MQLKMTPACNFATTTGQLKDTRGHFNGAVVSYNKQLSVKMEDFVIVTDCSLLGR